MSSRAVEVAVVIQVRRLDHASIRSAGMPRNSRTGRAPARTVQSVKATPSAVAAGGYVAGGDLDALPQGRAGAQGPP